MLNILILETNIISYIYKAVLETPRMQQIYM